MGDSAVGRNRPDLHDQAVTGARRLSPSPPAIASSPRRLVDIAVSQRLGGDAMSCHVLCIALMAITLTACVTTQDAHSPATQALADLRARAEAGDAEAQFILADMYGTGLGVPQDAAAAVAWYRRALVRSRCTPRASASRTGPRRPAGCRRRGRVVPGELGDARAQYNLGGLYAEGRGVPPDAAGAVAWYRRAAEQGHVRAQYNLGGLYAEGLGVPPDAVEALMWLTIAAARSTGAEHEQTVTARAAVAARMTPTDVREAERRAQAWHAAHPGLRNRAAPPSDTGRTGVRIALDAGGARGSPQAIVA